MQPVCVAVLIQPSHCRRRLRRTENDARCALKPCGHHIATLATRRIPASGLSECPQWVESGHCRSVRLRRPAGLLRAKTPFRSAGKRAGLPISMTSLVWTDGRDRSCRSSDFTKSPPGTRLPGITPSPWLPTSLRSCRRAGGGFDSPTTTSSTCLVQGVVLRKSV